MSITISKVRSEVENVESEKINLYEYVLKNGEGSRPDSVWIDDIWSRLEDDLYIEVNGSTGEGSRLVSDLVMDTIRGYLKDNPLVLGSWIGTDIIEGDFYINPDTGRDHVYDDLLQEENEE